jgi:hypothetical protein
MKGLCLTILSVLGASTLRRILKECSKLCIEENRVRRVLARFFFVVFCRRKDFLGKCQKLP